MANRENTSWNLERFVDSFILELDKAQDTLAVKGINRRLTYTVKDVALELNVFPQYDGDQVVFKTAQPGETGSSRMSIQLGSITDQQIAEHTSGPPSDDDISIDDIEEIDEDTKRNLRSIGVNSERALRKMENKNVNVESVLRRKTNGTSPVNYNKLADTIRKSRRKRFAPRANNVSFERAGDDIEILVEGANLCIDTTDQRFPAAIINNEPVDVSRRTENELRFRVKPSQLRSGENRLEVALDPYAVFSMTLEA